MPESSFSKDSDSESKHHSKSPSTLTRRPIHKDSGELDQKQRSTTVHDKNNSERLYPEIPKDESDEETEEASAKSEENEEQSGYSIFKFLLAVLSIVFVYWIGFRSHASDTGVNVSLDKIVNDMQNNFENQNPFTYRIVKSALKKVVNSHEPSAPAIITVIANKNAESKASEFSLYLAEKLVAQNYILINESRYWHSNPDDIKYKIDEEIRSKMKNNTLNVVIVDKLQNIPYEAAMIFHGFCDHELAPYKRAVFLFNVPLSVILPEDASNKQIDAAAMRQLRNIWQQATSDLIDSLITRITVSVVNIR